MPLPKRLRCEVDLRFRQRSPTPHASAGKLPCGDRSATLGGMRSAAPHSPQSKAMFGDDKCDAPGGSGKASAVKAPLRSPAGPKKPGRHQCQRFRAGSAALTSSSCGPSAKGMPGIVRPVRMPTHGVRPGERIGPESQVREPTRIIGSALPSTQGSERQRVPASAETHAPDPIVICDLLAVLPPHGQGPVLPSAMHRLAQLPRRTCKCPEAVQGFKQPPAVPLAAAICKGGLRCRGCQRPSRLAL